MATRRFQGSRTGVRLIPPVTSGAEGRDEVSRNRIDDAGEQSRRRKLLAGRGRVVGWRDARWLKKEEPRRG